MTSVVIPPFRLDAPTPEPLAGTLLDVATVVEGADWLEPGGLFDTYNCVAVDSKTVFPCPAVTISTPTQTASATATTGGSLPAGTYRAVVTAVNDRGETVKSNEVSQVTTGAASTVTFNWSPVSGATGYKIYITNGAAGSEARFVAALAASTSTIISSYPGGSVAGTPPTSNTALVTVNKTFGAPGWIDGIRFSVYGGVLCKGFDQADSGARLKAAFEARESVAVERAIMQSIFTTPPATDITPGGTAVDPTLGLALLEQDAACKYAGAPTIHVPRAIGTLLSRNGTVYRDGQKLYSVQGAKIASGGGYGCPNNSPTNTAPATGEAWIYASGEVVVARSELIVVGDLNRSTNETSALAERLYVAAVDCYTAAIKVKVA